MPKKYTKETVTYSIMAIVLSGGEGRRVGGMDKGLINLQGQALVERVIERLAPQVDDIVLSVNRNHQEYAKFGYRLIADEANENGRQGPLAGVISALQQYGESADYFLICTCDSPHLPEGYVARLKQQLIHSNSLAAVVFDGTAVQNLHCLISAQASASLIDFFTNGGRAMHRWLAQNKVVQVDFSAKADAFANYNTYESLN